VSSEKALTIPLNDVGNDTVVEVTAASFDPEVPVVDAMPDGDEGDQLSRNAMVRDSIVVSANSQSATQSSATQYTRAPDASAMTDPADVEATSGSAVVGSSRRLWEEEQSDADDDGADDTAATPSAAPTTNESSSGASDTASDTAADTGSATD
jgi:hypothetical protein